MIEHKGFGLRFDMPAELRQRDVEAFYKALRQIQGGDKQMSAPEFVGCVVRAAANCGWLPGLTADAVGEMRPAAVTWLSGEIQNLLGKATEIPGE